MSVPATGSKGKGIASSNWLALQKQLDATKRPSKPDQRSRKRQKLGSATEDGIHHLGRSARRFSEFHASARSFELDEARSASPEPFTAKRSYASRDISEHASASTSNLKAATGVPDAKRGEERAALQQMVLGNGEYSDSHRLPGKYLSLDCEMVGVGLDGSESSLARVSLVNFYGAVILDEFVWQRERVVDYRTQWSGIRESDLIKAKPFGEVQKRVADLLKDRILVGHAVYNDLKALLLSHPRPLTRDTQFYAHKFGLCKTKRAALRNLVKDELGLTIQSGEHSSVTDARATMAVYRLHKKEWEKGAKQIHDPKTTSIEHLPTKKRKATPTADDLGSDGESIAESSKSATRSMSPVAAFKSRQIKKKSSTSGEGSAVSYPGGGRKGVSSGLSTVVRKGHGGGGGATSRGSAHESKSQWWKQLPPAGPGVKSSLKLSMKK